MHIKQLDLFDLMGPEEEFTHVDGVGVVSSSQIIGKDIEDELSLQKDTFGVNLDSYTAVATIPEGVVNKWVREGFDFWNAPANEIKRKLAIDELDTFNVSGDFRFDH